MVGCRRLVSIPWDTLSSHINPRCIIFVFLFEQGTLVKPMVLPSPSTGSSVGGGSTALAPLSSSVFSSPVEQHAAELVNERLDNWELTIRTVIDFFTGTFSQ